MEGGLPTEVGCLPSLGLLLGLSFLRFVARLSGFSLIGGSGIKEPKGLLEFSEKSNLYLGADFNFNGAGRQKSHNGVPRLGERERATAKGLRATAKGILDQLMLQTAKLLLLSAI